MSDYDGQQTAFNEWMLEETDQETAPTIWQAYVAGWNAALANIREEVYAKFKVTPETLAANRAQIDRARKPLHCEDIAYGFARSNTEALSHVMGVTDNDNGNGEQGTSGSGCIPGAEQQTLGVRATGEASSVLSGEGSSSVSGGHAVAGASGAVLGYDAARGAVRRFKQKGGFQSQWWSHVAAHPSGEVEIVFHDGDREGYHYSVEDCERQVADGRWEEIPVEEPANAN